MFTIITIIIKEKRQATNSFVEFLFICQHNRSMGRKKKEKEGMRNKI